MKCGEGAIFVTFGNLQQFFLKGGKCSLIFTGSGFLIKFLITQFFTWMAKRDRVSESVVKALVCSLA